MRIRAARWGGGLREGWDPAEKVRRILSPQVGETHYLADCGGQRTVFGLLS